jgi:hypothetical protein
MKPGTDSGNTFPEHRGATPEEGQDVAPDELGPPANGMDGDAQPEQRFLSEPLPG